MKKLMIVVLLLVTSLAQAQEKEVVKRFKSQVYFDTDKYIIKAKENQKLNAIADTLLKYDDYQIRLYGHTDSVGSLEYNQKLSRNRMLAVQQYLYNKGLDSSQVKFAYFGETRPQVPNSDEQNKARNRRVEITVVIFKPKQQEVKKDIVKELVVEEEGCPEGDTIIQLASGTQIVIPGCAFGEYKRSEVCIEYEEATTPEEITDHGLSTQTTSGEGLMSFGMFKLTAKVCATGEEVKNISDSLYVQFPYNGPGYGTGNTNGCIPVNIGLYSMNGRGSWRGVNATVDVISGPDSAQRYLRAPVSSLNGQWVNCDAPLMVLGGATCRPNTKQAYKVRKYHLDKVYLTYTFADGINTRVDFDVIRDGRKAKGNVYCQSCAPMPQIKLWAWAHDDEGNKYVIEGEELSEFKARKWVKHCQTRFTPLIFGCVKSQGTTVRKFILKPKDFKEDIGKKEKKEKKAPLVIQFS